MSDNRFENSLKPNPEGMLPVDLHPCRFAGEWVGITDSLYADAINSLWMEGYMVDVVAIPNGKLQIRVQEGLPAGDR